MRLKDVRTHNFIPRSKKGIWSKLKKSLASEREYNIVNNVDY